jgi:hypothetical protein
LRLARTLPCPKTYLPDHTGNLDLTVGNVHEINWAILNWAIMPGCRQNCSSAYFQWKSAEIATIVGRNFSLQIRKSKLRKLHIFGLRQLMAVMHVSAEIFYTFSETIAKLTIVRSCRITRTNWPRFSAFSCMRVESAGK